MEHSSTGGYDCEVDVRLTGVAIANCSHSPSLGVADLVTDARLETVGTVAL